MALPPGSVAYLRYSQDDLFHERVLLAWVEQADYIVCTPDGDICIEEIRATNSDLDSVRFEPPGGGLPYGLEGSRIYAFAPRPSGTSLAGLLAEGATFARAERVARGLAGADAARAGERPGNTVAPVLEVLPEPAAAVAEGSAAAGGGMERRAPGQSGTWVLDEPSGTLCVGREVRLPSGAPDFGGRTLGLLDGRLVSISFVPPGVGIEDFVASRTAVLCASETRAVPRPRPGPARTLEVASSLMKAGPPSFAALRGPATVRDTVRALLGRGLGSFVAAQDRWVVESRIDPGSRSVHEHAVLSKALHLAIAEDGLDVQGLLSLEYLNRRRQLIEEAHREDAARPRFEGAAHFMGDDMDSGGTLLVPSLRAHVAAEIGREAAIDKERRKAREAKGGIRSTAKPEKGDGGGK